MSLYGAAFRGTKELEETLAAVKEDLAELPALVSAADEGELAWVPHDKMLDLPTWEGDRAFLTELLAGKKDINMTLCYEGEHCTVIRK